MLSSLPLPSSKFGALPKSPIISASPELENFRAALKTSDFSSCNSILRLTFAERLILEEEIKLMDQQIYTDKDSYGRTSLIWACLKGLFLVVDELLKKGANFRDKTKNGSTSLYLAAERGHADVCDLLLSKQGLGAGLWDREKTFGWTPLMVASRNGHIGVVKILLSYLGPSGYSQISHYFSKSGLSAEMYACIEGHVSILDLLLLHKRYTPSSDQALVTEAFTLFNIQYLEILDPCAPDFLEKRRKLVSVRVDYLSDKTNAKLYLDAETDQDRALLVNTWAESTRPHGASDNSISCNDFSKHPYVHKCLMLASFHGQLATIELLITRGADINYKCCNMKGCSALMVACAQGHASIVKFLLSKKAKTSYRDNVAGLSSALIATRLGYLNIVEMIARQSPGDIHDVDAFGDNCLHFATRSLRIDLIKFLLSKGARIHTKNQSGSSAIIIAVAGRTCRIDVIALLLSNGARVNETDDQGFSPLLWAASRGYVDAVELLISRGAYLHHKNEFQESALLLASRNGCCNVARFLLSQGANIRDQDSGRWSSLIWASYEGHIKVVELLLSKGGATNLANEERGRDGYNSILYAAKNGHRDIVELLLSHGADLNDRNHDGDNSVILACRGGFPDLVKLLLTKGANICDRCLLEAPIDFGAAHFEDIEVFQILSRWETTMALIILQKLGIGHETLQNAISDLYPYSCKENWNDILQSANELERRNIDNDTSDDEEEEEEEGCDA